MRKLFTFLVAFLATLSGAVWAEENPSGTSESAPYDLTRGELTITDDGIYWVTSSSQTNNGIEISGNPTVHLKGINIGVEGTAIEVKWGGHPTFILEGNENIIESAKGPAISVPHDGFTNTTQATFQGNGLLEINMEESGKVAIGNAGGLIGVPLTCGNITVNGGTIKTNGIIGTVTAGKLFKLEGNAVVICRDVDGGVLNNYEFTKGILFEGTTTGTMYGDVTLSSPLDLTDNTNTASLNLNGHTLTLADGYVLKCDAEKDINGGIVNAYRLNYVYGQLDGCSPIPNRLPSDYNRYAQKSTAELSKESLECSTKQDEFVGWMKENQVVSSIKMPEGPVSGTSYVDVKGAWVRKNLLVSTKKGEKKSGSILVSEGLQCSIDPDDGSNLPSGITQAGLTFTVTPTADAGMNTVTYKVTPTGTTQPVDVEVAFNVTDVAQEITQEDIVIDTDREWVYDGTTHNVVTVTVGGVELNEGENEDYVVSYNYKAFGEEQGQGKPVNSVKDAGIYTLLEVKGTGKDSDAGGYYGTVDYGGDEGITITVEQRPIDVKAIPQTIEVGGSFRDEAVLIGAGEGKIPTIESIPTGIQGESAAVSGNLALSQDANSQKPGKYEDAILQGTVALALNGNFDPKNYSMSFVPADLIVQKSTIDPDEVIIEIDGADTKDSKYIYNGVDYARLKKESISVYVKIGQDRIQIPTTDYAVSWLNAESEAVSEVKHVGNYKAKITFSGEIYGGTTKSISKDVDIHERPMIVNFKKLNKSTIGQTLNAVEWVEYYEDAVRDETPSITGTITVASQPVNDKYKVTFENLALIDNISGNFVAKDYSVTWKYNGTDITITDGDGDINIPIDTDDEGDGDGDGDIKLFRIYTDEVCAGVELEYSREVVKGGQSTIVTVNVEKGYDASALKLSYKEGMYGDWKPLTLNKDGQYQIKNIWNDIYVRAEGVVTGMEDIDGAARVYAKDGSLYIYTPQQDDIAVISMTGSVVKRTKQVGLQSYPLNQGIYVVRVGEQVFKVRVK